MHHALRPAASLADEAGEGGGLQPGDQRLVDIDAVPPPGMQGNRCFTILGDAHAAEAAGVVKRSSTQDSRGTAEECRVPLVQSALDDAVEHFVLGGHFLKRAEIALQRIGIEKEVRGLYQKQLRIMLEMSDRLHQEVSRRRMVGIENSDQLACGMCEAIVEIAGLGMLIAFAGQIVDVEFAA